jgi:hypothetical protein
MQSYDKDGRNPSFEIWRVSIDGAKQRLSHVPPDVPMEGIAHGILTRDGRYLVAQRYHRALIWDIATNKPRATPFLHLTPSPSSGRWIGIEKDTRQLVIVDEDFQVIRRFDEIRPARSFGFALDWSPDEQFIIWRNQIGFDHYNNWEGFWMNLDTGEKRELSGRFMDEHIAFTGRGGEFFRSGQDGAKSGWSGDLIVGAHLTIVPEGQAAARDLWRIKVDPKRRIPGALTNRPGNPPVRPAPGCDLFAIGLPRPTGQVSGWIWHLIDRQGTTWQFPGEDNGEFISPFDVVGFAEGGKTIVAHDRTKLFAFSVSAITRTMN